MNKTYKVSEEFIKEAHESACQDWKRKLEKEFPEVFTLTRLEIGQWYKSTRNSALFYVTDINKNGGIKGDCKGFGFNYDGRWTDEKWEFAGYINDEGWNVKATAEEVEEALTKEAKRRGLVPNIFIKSIWCPDPEMSPYPTPENYVFREWENTLMLDCKTHALTIFKDGIWAKPVEIPTQKEIDRVLNYLKTLEK